MILLLSKIIPSGFHSFLAHKKGRDETWINMRSIKVVGWEFLETWNMCIYIYVCDIWYMIHDTWYMMYIYIYISIIIPNIIYRYVHTQHLIYFWHQATYGVYTLGGVDLPFFPKNGRSSPIIDRWFSPPEVIDGLFFPSGSWKTGRWLMNSAQFAPWFFFLGTS